MTFALAYPALMLADARKQAGDALLMVSKGVDPATELRRQGRSGA